MRARRILSVAVVGSILIACSPSKKAEHEADFRSRRECGSTADAPNLLVRAFVLAIDRRVYDGRKPATEPFLKRLAADREDPFAVYRSFRKAFHDRTIPDGSTTDGWAIMDRYEKERPDFSKTEIECRVVAIDELDYGYIGREEVRFPSFQTDRGALRAVAWTHYLADESGALAVQDWGFGTDLNAGSARMWIAQETRPGGLENLPDVVQTRWDRESERRHPRR